MDDAIWQVLGIAPTDDVGAIRRAYAAALKAIDPERDPKSFVALRAAYDSARSGQSHHFEPLAAPSVGADAVSPLGRRADRAEIARLVRDISDRLRTHVPDPTADEVLSDLTLRLLAEVEVEVVDYHAELEEWLAATIAANIPRSDAMIRPVQAYFSWHTRQHIQYRPEKASVIIDRWRSLNYAERVLFAETGRHHRAYLALQAPPLTGLFVYQDVDTLRAIERFFAENGYYPDIAGVTFDPLIIGQWQEQLRKNVLRMSRTRLYRKPVTRIGRAVFVIAGAMMVLGIVLAIVL